MFMVVVCQRAKVKSCAPKRVNFKFIATVLLHMPPNPCKGTQRSSRGIQLPNGMVGIVVVVFIVRNVETTIYTLPSSTHTLTYTYTHANTHTDRKVKGDKVLNLCT